MVDKGSVAVNGISLTIMALKGKVFTLNIIPHTTKETTLDKAKQGDKVNIETDILAKYLLRGREVSRQIDENFLKSNGFM